MVCAYELVIRFPTLFYPPGSFLRYAQCAPSSTNNVPLAGQRHAALPQTLGPVKVTGVLAIQLDNHPRPGQLPRVVAVEVAAQLIFGEDDLGGPPQVLWLARLRVWRRVLDGIRPGVDLGGGDEFEGLEPQWWVPWWETCHHVAGRSIGSPLVDLCGLENARSAHLVRSSLVAFRESGYVWRELLETIDDGGGCWMRSKDHWRVRRSFRPSDSLPRQRQGYEVTGCVYLCKVMVIHCTLRTMDSNAQPPNLSLSLIARFV